MRKIVPGALAGLVVAAVLAAPAYAATVSVRVEGDAQTLLPRTVVTTTRATGRQARQPDVPGQQRARRGERRDRRATGRACTDADVLELFVGRSSASHTRSGATVTGRSGSTTVRAERCLRRAGRRTATAAVLLRLPDGGMHFQVALAADRRPRHGRARRDRDGQGRAYGSTGDRRHAPAARARRSRSAARRPRPARTARPPSPSPDRGRESVEATRAGSRAVRDARRRASRPAPTARAARTCPVRPAALRPRRTRPRRRRRSPA